MDSLIAKFIVDLLCGVCDALGGWHVLWMRRYLIPILLGVMASICSHTWWVGLMLLPAIGTLSIGYSKDGNFGRALWIGLQCAVFGLGLFLTGHLTWFLYAPYIIFGCVLGGIYRNIQQIIGDLMTGCYMGLIVFLIH